MNDQTAKPDLLSVVPLMPPQMQRLDEYFKVHTLPAPGPGREALLKNLAPGLRFVQTGGSAGADEPLMAALPNVEIIASMGVGTDSIDLEAASKRGIAVTNTPGVLDDDVADLAIALMIMCSRKLTTSERFVHEGGWLRGVFPLARKVSGKRLGIVGLGRIGKAIARRAEAMGMDISYHGRAEQHGVTYRYVPGLRHMAAQVDFLVLSCPGGPETFHIVDSVVMEALGPDGILVNVSRGSVVDQKAMVAALAGGSLGGAGLDVFEDEPRVPPELLSMDNVVLVPHVGSATVETRTAMADLVLANLLAHLNDEPLLSRVV